MARMLGSSHIWNQRYCPWRETLWFEPGTWNRATQVVFKRRRRRIEERAWQRDQGSVTER